MNSVLSNPVDIIAGALLWPILVAACYGIRYGYRRIFAKYPLEGNWHVYHYTMREGAKQLIHCEWRIRKGIRRKYRGGIFYGDVGQAKRKIYRLCVDEEKGTFRFAARSVVDSETFQVRTKGIFFDGCQPLYGVFVGINFDSKAFAGIEIVTKTELTREEIAGVIGRNFQLDAEKLMITVDNPAEGE